MTFALEVIGIGADGAGGLRPELRERIGAAGFLAGGGRHLGYFPDAVGERFELRDNLDDLARALHHHLPQRRCVVLASGDPLFFGIGRFLVERFPNVRLEPALSSMQLAFARARLPWHNAALASIHGRALRPTLLPLLGRPTIGLFTQDGTSPAAVAQFFLSYLGEERECEVPTYRAAVGENLGGPEERLTWWELDGLTKQHFTPLNYLILVRNPNDDRSSCDVRRALVPGVPDMEFARPRDQPEIMTRQEVRAVALGKLSGATEPGDVAWDIGAGLGTMAVEMAVLRPGVEVVAVERDPARVKYLRDNRRRFDALNIRVVEGEAPTALRDEVERPRCVFLGGSGTRLSDILDLVAERLHANGRLVANFVTLEHLGLTLERLRQWQWPLEVTEVHVARSDELGGLTGLKPQRGVFLVSATKPGGGP